MKNLSIVISFLFLIAGCKTVDHKTINANTSVNLSIKKHALEFLEDDRHHSVSIGIYKDGKKYSGHFGELTIGKGNLPTGHTIYDIASVTKTMVGLVLANAVLEKKISIDDDVRKYLDGEYPNMEYQGVPIRIRDIITHKGGIPSNFPDIAEHYETDEKNDSTFFKVAKIYAALTKADFFNLISTDFLNEKPGSSYKYSNIAPQLIAHILENIYNRPFDELLQSYVFDKYNMPNARVLDKDIDMNNYPRGYNENGILMPHLPNCLWNAAGGVKLTMPDMLNYLAVQVEQKDSAVKESHREIVVEDDIVSRAYFYRIEKSEEGYAYMHNGYDSGTQNWFIAYPKYKLGISVITNTSYPDINIWQTAMGLVDDLKPFGVKSIGRAIKKMCETDVEKGIAQYYELKKRHFDKYNFSDENELNTLGYQLMAKDKLPAAITIFKLLVAEFPDRFNPYDSLGEAYFNNKQYDLAIKNYKKSLALNPENTNAEDMIEKIKQLSK